ncbi:MAG: hypothetical protein ABL888_06575, partial [Pirellulaceae bacterium]
MKRRNSVRAILFLGLIPFILSGCETTDYEPLRVKRIKELEAEVEALQARVKELESGSSAASANVGKQSKPTSPKTAKKPAEETKVVSAEEFQLLKQRDAAAVEALKPFEAAFTTDPVTGLVSEIDLSNSRNGNEALSQLVNFPGLKSLTVKGSDLVAASFDEIAKLTALEKLTMDLAPVTNESLQKLLTLKNLRYLQLFRADISDEGLGIVAQFPKLEQLRIGQTRVGDDGIAKLVSLKTLKAI